MKVLQPFLTTIFSSNFTPRSYECHTTSITPLTLSPYSSHPLPSLSHPLPSLHTSPLTPHISPHSHTLSPHSHHSVPTPSFPTSSKWASVGNRGEEGVWSEGRSVRSEGRGCDASMINDRCIDDRAIDDRCINDRAIDDRCINDRAIDQCVNDRLSSMDQLSIIDGSVIDHHWTDHRCIDHRCTYHRWSKAVDHCTIDGQKLSISSPLIFDSFGVPYKCTHTQVHTHTHMHAHTHRCDPSFPKAYLLNFTYSFCWSLVSPTLHEGNIKKSLATPHHAT